MPCDIDSVELPGGVRLQYCQQGERDGAPLLLLHGYSDSWRSFEPVLPYLPSSIRALALTQRGHGDSSRPDAGYATTDLAADAIAFLDALGIEAAVVAGHSMGCTVAQRIALDHPGRVRGLVLAGASTTWLHNPAIGGELAAAVAELRDPVDPAFAREFQESTVAEPLDPELLEVFVAESLMLPARVWQAVMRGTLLDDFTDELGAIAAPALLVWGEHDGEVSPRHEQDALLARIPGAELSVYEGAGHAVHWERPERFAADLAASVLAGFSAAPARA